MAPGATPEDQLAFVLSVMQNAELSKINYAKVAEKYGLTTRNAQRRFKAIVEASGDFKLVKGQLVLTAADDDSATLAAPAAAPEAAHTPKKATAAPIVTPKKRKLNAGKSQAAQNIEAIEDIEDIGDIEHDSGSAA